MVQDLVHNLCESLVENIDGVSGATSRKVVVATPVITLTDNSVTITCDTTGAIIYYTLDGSTPTSSSSQYSAAFTLDSSCTIKAIAIKGGKSSGIAEEEYVKPITYLTQWRMMGNSEVHGNEIWSCGEYSEVDNKWHICILPEGYGIVDIALDEPLRKVNDVADSIEYADGVTIVTRNLGFYADLSQCRWTYSSSTARLYFTPDFDIKLSLALANILCPIYDTITQVQTTQRVDGIATQAGSPGFVVVYDSNYNTAASKDDFVSHMQGVELLYELNTPTTETIQVPQIEEADSYTCVISQGGKAVSWSSFETE